MKTLRVKEDEVPSREKANICISDVGFSFPSEFTYSRFRFRLVIEKNAGMPVFKGSMLRGLLGTALRRLNCNVPMPCDKCLFVKNCAYSILFKPELVNRFTLITPPFVIHSPDIRRAFKVGDSLEVWLTIFGAYSQYFDYFFNAFNYGMRLGLGRKRIPFRLEAITDDVSGEWVYRDREVNRDWQPAMGDFSELKPGNQCKMRLHFLSPVFLRRNKQPVVHPEMSSIVDALVRRVHIVNRSIWKDLHFKIDKGFIDELGVSIVSQDVTYRKSFKNSGYGNKVELSGFYGKVDYVGDLGFLYPLLKVGEVLHIGVRTSYGLGKYRVEERD